MTLLFFLPYILVTALIGHSARYHASEFDSAFSLDFLS